MENYSLDVLYLIRRFPPANITYPVLCSKENIIDAHWQGIIECDLSLRDQLGLSSSSSRADFDQNT